MANQCRHNREHTRIAQPRGQAFQRKALGLPFFIFPCFIKV